MNARSAYNDLAFLSVPGNHAEALTMHGTESIRGTMAFLKVRTAERSFLFRVGQETMPTILAPNDRVNALGRLDEAKSRETESYASSLKRARRLSSRACPNLRCTSCKSASEGGGRTTLARSTRQRAELIDDCILDTGAMTALGATRKSNAGRRADANETSQSVR
jgi:hypothetical protein